MPKIPGPLRQARNLTTYFQPSGRGYVPHIRGLTAHQTPENHVNQAKIAGRPAAMWRSLLRQSLTIFCHRHSAMAFVSVVVIALGALPGLQCEAFAQEEQLSKAGQAGQSILIREHAGWNRNCDAIAHPELYLSEPPRHGQICARIENIKISSMYVGTESQCIGRLERGVRLIYRSDAAYAGDDSLRYAAQYPSVLRGVQVQLTVAADAGSAVPSNTIGVPIAPARQAPGPIPDCAEPVF